jgi:hypothetical protein
MFGLVTRRQHDARLADARAEAGRLRAQRDKAIKDRETAVFNRERILHQYNELDEKHTAACLVNERLTEDLTKARAVLAEAVASDKTSTDLAAALERAELLQQQLDDARLLASRLTALVESRQQLDDQQRPIDAAAPIRREPTSTRLRRERERVRKLEEIVRELQASHVADTRELHDLRQGGAA